METSRYMYDKKGLTVEIFEKLIIERMYLNKLTLRESLIEDMEEAGVDSENVFEATDYLEAMTDLDMDKVGMYMAIITGQHPDMVLREL